MNLGFEDRVIAALENELDIEVIRAGCLVHNNQEAVEEARELEAQQVDGVIFNYSIWVYPNLSVVAARQLHRPLLLLSNLNPVRAGLVGMMASAGSLDQLGMQNYRVWGDINDLDVRKKVLQFARAARTVTRLQGMTYGMFGGRSMGMYTGVAEQSKWMQQFGVDCDHVDEMEILRCADLIDSERVNLAFDWLTRNIGGIHYDGSGLTQDKLRFQIRCYLATKDMVQERGYDFIGIKCQPEMGNHFVTQCLTQAFLNDPYDMEGPKKLVVCSCENDMDGGLTMQILHLLTGLPTLFFDFRHYDAAEQVFVFSNCGSQSTWYAARSDQPETNLSQVNFYPQTPEFYPAGGTTVQYMAGPGPLTCARLSRKKGIYRMTLFPAEAVTYPREKMDETSPEWPQAFIRTPVTPEQLINEYGSNHAHAVAGSWIDELVMVCELLGIETVVYQ
jgi:L-fucose isomerase